MPAALKRPCAHPGCPKLIDSGGIGARKNRGRCPEHAKQVRRSYEAIRGTSTERGYGSRNGWRRYSESFRREFPLCGQRPPEAPQTKDSICAAEGRIVASELTDHITPISRPDDPLFFDRANHQALCWHCHQVKRSREARDGRARW